jgi:hypothetical protein
MSEDNTTATKLLEQYQKVFDQLLRHKNSKITVSDFLKNLVFEDE